MSIPDTQFSGPEVCALSARETVNLLKTKEISPMELLDAAYTRIAQVEPHINATVTLCQDRARKALTRLEADAKANDNEPGWLTGLPNFD